MQMGYSSMHHSALIHQGKYRYMFVGRRGNLTHVTGVPRDQVTRATVDRVYIRMHFRFIAATKQGNKLPVQELMAKSPTILLCGMQKHDWHQNNAFVDVNLWNALGQTRLGTWGIHLYQRLRLCTAYLSMGSPGGFVFLLKRAKVLSWTLKMKRCTRGDLLILLFFIYETVLWFLIASFYTVQKTTRAWI